MVSAPGQNASTRSRAAAGQREDQPVEGVPGADQHRRRHLPAAALRVEQRLDRVRGEGVRADPVDRVGRKHDQLAVLDRLDRRGDASVPVGERPAVVEHHEEPVCHAGGTDGASGRYRAVGGAVAKRGRPARSRCVGDVGEPAVRAQQRPAPPRRGCRRARRRHAPPGRSRPAARSTTGRITASPSGAAEDRLRRVVPGHLRRYRRRRPARTAGCRAARPPGRPARPSSSGSVTSAGDHLDRPVPGRGPLGGVAPQPGQRRRRPLHRDHPRPGHLLGHRQRDRARAAAQVHHQRSAGAGRPAQCRPARRPSRPAARSPAGARRPPGRPPAPGAGTPPSRQVLQRLAARSPRPTTRRAGPAGASARRRAASRPATPRARTPPAARPRRGPARSRRRPARAPSRPTTADGPMAFCPFGGVLGEYGSRHNHETSTGIGVANGFPLGATSAGGCCVGWLDRVDDQVDALRAARALMEAAVPPRRA